MNAAFEPQAAARAGGEHARLFACHARRLSDMLLRRHADERARAARRAQQHQAAAAAVLGGGQPPDADVI